MLITSILKDLRLGQSLISIEFLTFLAATVIAYYSLARRCQWQFLLAVSCLYYALNNRWEYLTLLAAVIGINCVAGQCIQNASRKGVGRFYLGLSIGLNSAILLVFKYGHFFGTPLDSTGITLSSIGRSVAAPLGISYFTFKAISYVIDVHRAKVKCEKNFGKFALFMSFFLEISAGPIDRARDLLPQMDLVKTFLEKEAVSGLRLLLWGFFKKLVVANNLAPYITQIFGAPRDHSGTALLLGTYFVAFQIYCDFSGYTDIVRGAGRLLGYRLPENFSSPYLSRSISEFWTRWHITLSTWLRDYLFLPLSFFFSRRIKSDSVLFLESNVLIYFSSALVTFLIAGIWHGSAWTFIVWGLLHGFYLSFSNLTRPLRKRLRKTFPLHRRYPTAVAVLQIFICFHLVSFSWVFFRASSLKDALYIVRHLVPKHIGSFVRGCLSSAAQFEFGTSKYAFIILCGLLVLWIIFEIHQKGMEIPRFLGSQKRILRWTAYYLVLLAILFFGEFGMKEFIYVQF